MRWTRTEVEGEGRNEKDVGERRMWEEVYGTFHIMRYGPFSSPPPPSKTSMCFVRRICLSYRIDSRGGGGSLCISLCCIVLYCILCMRER